MPIESGMGVERALVKADVRLLGYLRLVPGITSALPVLVARAEKQRRSQGPGV